MDHFVIWLFFCACLCRLWPTAQTFTPRRLKELTLPTVISFIESHSKVLWVPHAGAAGGQWTSIQEACLLPEASEPCSTVITVARRAGLLLPGAPQSILKVQHQFSLSVLAVLYLQCCVL